MTETQIKYWDYRESRRHNLVTESQGERRLVSDIAVNNANIRKSASDIKVNEANVAYTNMRTQLTASEITKTKAQTGNINADTKLKTAQTKNVSQDTKLKSAQTSNVKQDTKLKSEQTKKTKAETELTKVKTTNTKVDTSKKSAEINKIKAETSKIKTETKLTKTRVRTEFAKGTLTQKQVENYVLDQLNRGNDIAQGIATVGYCAELALDKSQSSTVKEKAMNTIVGTAKKVTKDVNIAKVAYQNGVPVGIIVQGNILRSAKAIKDWFSKLVNDND